MAKIRLLTIALIVSRTLLSQGGLLNSTLSFEPGVYSCTEVLKMVEQQGIAISYSSNSVGDKTLNLTKTHYSLHLLLMQIFDEAKYATLEQQGKILVVPLNKAEITISGYVEDATSRERLIGINVFIADLNAGTITNKYGFYSLSIRPPSDTFLLSASAVGYSTVAMSLSHQKDHRLDIALNTFSQPLEEVVVIDEDLHVDNVQMSQIRLTSKELKGIPAFFGEEDVIKTIQLMPGVQTASEGNINYIVRGGSPDQNLILLDGVPVYNAGHLFGYFSVFNVDAVKNVQFTKGGFPARYGGRLSSVLEIDMKEGNMEEYHGAGSIGLLAAKLTLEGPIVKNKASFMVAARRTYFDIFYRPFMDENDAGYVFHDLNAKINYKFSRKDRLYLSFYTGKDKLFADLSLGDNTYENRMEYGNATGSVRYNHLFSEKLFSNLTATYTRFNLSNNSSTLTPFDFDGQYYFSRIEDYGLKYDLDYSCSARHYLRLGGAYTYHVFKPGAVQYTQRDARQNLDSVLTISPFNYSNDAYVYVEDDWKINDRWRINAGLHYSAYFVEDNFYHSLQPRVAGRYMLQKDWALKASYAYMQQYVHLLTNSRIGLPTDLWVSSTDKVAPQKSHQWAVGTTKYLWDNRYEITSELYYKRMSQLLTFKEGNQFSSAVNWEDQVTTGGIGDAYGCEVLFRKSKGKTTGWVAYTLAKTTRQFKDINNGIAFPFKYDRRHDLKFIANHNFSERFYVGLAFFYNSGLRATIPTGTFTHVDGSQQIIYSEKNAYTYPDYHRLDLSCNWHKKKKWGERTFGIGLYNAYSRQNPYHIYFVSNATTRKAFQVSMFPILPNFTYSFTF